ncbi:hypothetical protein [Ktedonospora formicarum]|uniref:Uncharacterized protein n=1 Tax=Ktedonospora formicarum TaxID=2778364 RepID=A0A8J3IEG6_9CHLR|nr:hypothetical protein [Ktedonospora formicarum]GHO50868.1 hypothetical protein KSX_90310 [Ktedonospora formicarum]
MTENASSDSHTSLRPVRQMQSRIDQRAQIEQLIYQNKNIAAIDVLRDALLTHMAHMSLDSCPSPAQLHLQKRQKRLRPMLPCLRQLLDSHSISPRMRSLVHNMQLAAQLGWQAQDFRQLPSVFDRRFNCANDFLEPIFSAIFEEKVLLRQWMRGLDTHVEASSARLLEAMDRQAQRGEAPLRAQVVLVGGGPLASIVASILGAFFSVTVVTEHSSLGKPWRNRPLYINSSSLITDFHGAPLPLLAGPTTRIIGRQQLNNLDVDLLLQTDIKSVPCEDGSTARYIAGPRLGDLVATNLLCNVDAYLVNQRVEVSTMRQTANGRLRLTLMDMRSGDRREMDASAVFLLTGPGREQSKVPGASSQRVYQEAQAQLDATLRQIRHQFSWHDEALRRLEAVPSMPGVRAQCQWLRTRLAQMYVPLPRVLTLTAIEKLYELWDDFGADPLAFPLNELGRKQSIAYIGNGDTMRTLKELVDGRGPLSAYPEGCQPHNRKSTIYNEQATTPQEYDQVNRRRYQGVYTPTTTSIPGKARRYRTIKDASLVEVTHQDEQGRLRRRVYNYLFDCTGLQRTPIETTLPASFPLQGISDLQGITVGRGGAELFLTGAALGWRISDLPGELQRIIQGLGIAENTISLWVNGPLAERLAYTYAATRPHSNT